MARDPYAELGVARNASADDIRKAFRKLAKKHHPDANRGDKAAEEKFKHLSVAFDLLGDPDKRRKYDAGMVDADGHDIQRGFAGHPSGAGGGGFRGTEFEGVDLGDILGDMFGARGAGRGGFGARGADIRARLEIDLEEAIKGARKRITFSAGRALDVNIPTGAVDGQVLRLRGQGSPGRAGPGDALIELVIRPHPIFRAEGEQLHMDLLVSLPDAVLGGKVTAQTPDGPVTLSVPRGANSGAVLRLKGRGLSDPQGRRGDLLARLVLTLPEETDSELVQFAQTWREQRPYTPRRRS